MLRNTFKLIFRGLHRDLGFSFINIAGLGIGLAACLLILIYVLDEIGYDRDYEQVEQIYRLHSDFKLANKERATATPSWAALSKFRSEIAAIEAGASVQRGNGQLQVGANSSEEEFIIADTSFFEILTQDFLSGNPSTVLDAPGSTVLTESKALRLFGTTDVVGRSMQLENGEFTVTGVIADPTSPSHLTYDIVVSRMTLSGSWREWRDEAWFNGGGEWVYLKLAPGSTPEDVEQEMAEVFEGLAGDKGRALGLWYTFSLMPVSDVHLYSNRVGEFGPVGNINYVRSFSAIALIILVIACVNFANLSTARSTMRAREVGVRKAAGAQRADLIRRYLLESFVMTVIGLLIALVIVYAALGWMNEITGKDLSMAALLDGRMVAGIAVLVVTCTITAGVYPAFVLSAFRPMTVLRGFVVASSDRSFVRRGLVVGQFMISVGLIIGTLAITGQIDFMKNKPLGFDKEAVAVIQMDTENKRETWESFRQRLLQHPQITHASFASMVPGRAGALRLFVPEGRDTTETFSTVVARVDYDYVDTYGMEMAAGRFYSRDFGSDSLSAYVINQAAARDYGWSDEEAVGKMLLFRSNRESEIIGVVQDYHFGPVTEEIVSLVFILESASRPERLLSIRLADGASVNMVASLTEIWNEFEPVRPLNLTFVSEDLQSRYGEQESAAELISVFTLLAVFIAALGLFGLASFTVQRRAKEIGIRKVLGARTPQLLALVTSEFAMLLLVANIIAWPVAYIVITRFWLSQFPYRMNLEVGIFLIAALVSFGVMLIATIYHSISAATANPATALRSD